jgi:hypothetical protein
MQRRQRAAVQRLRLATHLCRQHFCCQRRAAQSVIPHAHHQRLVARRQLTGGDGVLQAVGDLNLQRDEKMIVEFESRILALIDDMVEHASDDELFASGYL